MVLETVLVVVTVLTFDLGDLVEFIFFDSDFCSSILCWSERRLRSMASASTSKSSNFFFVGEVLDRRSMSALGSDEAETKRERERERERKKEQERCSWREF